jgi:hypothetical protein
LGFFRGRETEIILSRMASSSAQYFLHLSSNVSVHAGGKERYLARYRLLLGAFIIGLILSGLTAFPLRAELSAFAKFIGVSDPSGYATLHGLQRWLAFVSFGLEQTYLRFPFFGYATDWLGYAHLVIALFFFLPLIDPRRYRGVLHVGIVACVGVFIIALACGPMRQIPVFWRLIDCSFGLLGAIPLLICLRLTSRME